MSASCLIGYSLRRLLLAYTYTCTHIHSSYILCICFASADKEKIIDLATDDKEWMKTIADHVDPLKDTVDVILIGNHEDVLKEPSNWNMFIASSRCHFKEDEKLTKRSLGEDVFDLDGIKNIATRPSVIVYILPATDDIKQVKKSKNEIGAPVLL